jgi:hypothetical protein
MCSLPDGALHKWRIGGGRPTRLAYDPTTSLLFVGLNVGSVRAYNWPLLPEHRSSAKSPVDGMNVSAGTPSTSGGGKRRATAGSGHSADGGPARGGSGSGSNRPVATPGSTLASGSGGAGVQSVSSARPHHHYRENPVGDLDAPPAESEAEPLTASTLVGSQAEPPCMDFPLHTAPVTGLCVSQDSRYLFSTGADGCLFLLGIPFLESTAPIVAARRIHVPRRRATLTTAQQLLLTNAGEHAPPGEDADEDGAGGDEHGDGSGGDAAGLSPWVWEPTPSRLFNSGVTLLPRPVYDELTSRIAGVDAEMREVWEVSDVEV